MKCIVCDKDIMDGDIFMMMKIDMRRLIYNVCKEENDFLVPDGPVHLMETLILCENCSNGLMKLAPKHIASALSQMK